MTRSTSSKRQKKTHFQPPTAAPTQPASSAVTTPPAESAVLAQGANLLARTTTAASPTVQAKLTIGQPHDPYEQEADRVASEVVQHIHTAENIATHPQDLTAQRQLDPSNVTSLIQPQGALTGGTAPDAVEAGINAARGGGTALDAGLQQSMGSAMGADFSRVKVHTDRRADRLNRSIQARAFTTGNDIFFRQGEYNPGNKGGQALIAHELTHTLQQGATPVNRMVQRAPDEEAPAMRAGLANGPKRGRREGDDGAFEISDAEQAGWDEQGIPLRDIYGNHLIEQSGGSLESPSGIPYYDEPWDLGDGEGPRYRPRVNDRYHYPIAPDGRPLITQIVMDRQGIPLVDLGGNPP